MLVILDLLRRLHTQVEFTRGNVYETGILELYLVELFLLLPS